MNSLPFILIQRTLGWNLFRSIFAWLDRVSYYIFKLSLQAIFDISNATILTDDVLDNFATRIYFILGIFMVFKVTITLLSYLVDPDKITDKSEGFSKIIGRIIISICMLAGLPFLWNLLFGKVVNDKTLTEIAMEAVPRFIIGKKTQMDNTSSQMDDVADNIIWATYSVAFRNNDSEKSAVTECGDGCTMEYVTEHINDSIDGHNDQYKFSYLPVIGMVLGVIMSFIMVGIAIDVAIRAFKLLILRLIAPIPIMSYVLPKSSKSGGIFNNWVKTLISTWLDLFVKLSIIYFVLYILDVLLTGGFNLKVDGMRSVVVIIFIIIGLLLFAKQAPKFILDILGIKSPQGSIGLSGMAAAGGALLGGAGLGGALAAGASQLGEGAEGMSQGKSVGGGLTKGRTLAARMKTGDPNAKPKTLAENIGQRASIFQAKRKGITADSVADAKKSMYAANDAASNANALRERFNSGSLTEGDLRELEKYGISGDTLNTDNVNKYVNARNTEANKAKSHYEKSSSYAKQMGINVDKALTEDIRINKRGKFDSKYYHPGSENPNIEQGAGTSGLLDLELSTGSDYHAVSSQSVNTSSNRNDSGSNTGARPLVDDSDLE